MGDLSDFIKKDNGENKEKDPKFNNPREVRASIEPKFKEPRSLTEGFSLKEDKKINSNIKISINYN